MPSAIRAGIGIKEALHYTLHDLSLEIIFRNEKIQHDAWLYGARVREAIASCFDKKIKYGEEPKIYTKDERSDNERKAFMDFVNRWAR